jgi:hypothetical protein
MVRTLLRRPPYNSRHDERVAGILPAIRGRDALDTSVATHQTDMDGVLRAAIYGLARVVMLNEVKHLGNERRCGSFLHAGEVLRLCLRTTMSRPHADS